MNKLEEAQTLLEKKTNPNNLKSFPIRECDNCGVREWLYLCEQGHGKVFCKECLTATKLVGQEGRVFRAKCTPKGDCNYLPIFEYGKQPN